jgi:GNAT superfamily N-acetyltransferase
MAGLRIYAVTPHRLDHLADLFDSHGATHGCWCMFFLLKRQDYYAGRRGGNEEVFKELTCQGEVPLGREGTPVGWVAAWPRSRYPVATGPRSVILKDRDRTEDNEVWLVPCFFVRVGARRTGITRALLAAAVDFAEEQGAKAVEGFPWWQDRRAGLTGTSAVSGSSPAAASRRWPGPPVAGWSCGWTCGRDSERRRRLRSLAPSKSRSFRRRRR